MSSPLIQRNQLEDAVDIMLRNMSTRSVRPASTGPYITYPPITGRQLTGKLGRIYSDIYLRRIEGIDDLAERSDYHRSYSALIGRLASRYIHTPLGNCLLPADCRQAVVGGPYWGGYVGLPVGVSFDPYFAVLAADLISYEHWTSDPIVSNRIVDSFIHNGYKLFKVIRHGTLNPRRKFLEKYANSVLKRLGPTPTVPPTPPVLPPRPGAPGEGRGEEGGPSLGSRILNGIIRAPRYAFDALYGTDFRLG